MHPPAEPPDKNATLPRRRRLAAAFVRFLRAEATGGVVLMINTVLALGLARSPWASQVRDLWHWFLGGRLHGIRVGLTLADWINDGLMALFFLLVGMEIKRELIAGELGSVRKAAMPVLAALGGMLMPALLYLATAQLAGDAAHPGVRRGWAIPTATDIAFTIGVMALLGRRVPMGLRIFVTALAIADDLGAVVVIALFYSGQLHLWAIGAVAAITLALALCNRLGVRRLSPYLLLGLLLWTAMLHSGIHATIAGVILGACIPLASTSRLEKALQYPVALGVLPLFALCNAGITLPADMEALRSALVHPATAGVFLGLVIGKPIGIVAAALLSARLGLGELPDATPPRILLGAAMLCGIGFTMSIFTAQLAFVDDGMLMKAKLGIFAGSLCAAVAGTLYLRMVAPSEPNRG